MSYSISFTASVASDLFVMRRYFNCHSQLKDLVNLNCSLIAIQLSNGCVVNNEIKQKVQNTKGYTMYV